MNKYVFILFLTVLLQFTLLGQDRTQPLKLSLKQALEIGLEHHPVLKKSKQLIDAYNGRYYREISPSPLNLSVTNEFIPKNAGISNPEERTFEISQNFEFPTIYFARSAKAKAEISSAEFNYEDQKTAVRSLIKRSYYTALSKKLLMDIVSENLIVAAEFLKKAEIRYKSGEGTNLEFLTAKIQFAEAKAMIETAAKEYKTSLAELNFSMGNAGTFNPDSIIFTDSLKFTNLAVNLNELTEKSIKNNPYLIKLAFEKESAGISKNIAYMSYLPSLNASYMFQSLNSNNNYYGVRLGLSLPLWFMLDQRGQVQESNANFEIVNYELTDAVNSVKLKIKSAFIDFQHDSGRVQLYLNELNPQTNEIYKTAFLSYQAGEISYLEFLQAKFTTFNTKTNFIKSLFDYKEAVINLEQASGLILE